MEALIASPEAAVNAEWVAEHARVSKSLVKGFLDRLVEEGATIPTSDGRYVVSGYAKVFLALRAIELGSDPEKISQSLGWKEFEKLVAGAFELFGYETRTHVRFKALGRYWEVDVLALGNDAVVSVDCKLLKRASPWYVIAKAAKAHRERTEALAHAETKWVKEAASKGFVIPVVIPLREPRYLFYEGVYVVPIHRLRDFILHIPTLRYAELESG